MAEQLFPQFLNAGAEKADMIIPVSRNDETNMIVCQLASSLFNVTKKLPEYELKILEGKWVNYLANQIFQLMSISPN